MKLAQRHPEWEPRLAAVVDAWRGREHQPVQGKDCAAFVLACIEAVSGERLAFELRPYKTVAGQERAMRAMGWAGLPDAADTCLGARIAPLAAHRGDVVSDGAVLGIKTAAGCVAFGEGGMTAIAPVMAWPVGRCDG